MIDNIHNDLNDTRDGYRWDDYRPEDLLRAGMGTYRRRYRRSIAIACEWLDQCSAPYVAVSGGKDSVAVLHLVQGAARSRGAHSCQSCGTTPAWSGPDHGW